MSKNWISKIRILTDLQDVSANSPVHWSGIQTDIGWIHYVLSLKFKMAALVGPFINHRSFPLKVTDEFDAIKAYGLIQHGLLGFSGSRVFRKINAALKMYAAVAQKEFKAYRLPDYAKEDFYIHYVSRFDRFYDFKYIENNRLSDETVYVSGLSRQTWAIHRTRSKLFPGANVALVNKPDEIIVPITSEIYKGWIKDAPIHIFRIPDWIPATHPSFVGSIDLIPYRYRGINYLLKHNVNFRLVAYAKTIRDQTLELFPQLEGKVDAINVVVPDFYKPIDKNDEVNREAFAAILEKYTQPVDNPKKHKKARKALADLIRKKKDYFLVLGLATLDPRKNFEYILEAVKEFRHKLPPEQRSKVFVLVKGGMGWQENRIWRAMKAIEKDAYLLYIRIPLSFEDLRLLYNFSSVFVFPTYTEGFGLPPLEALACGTPSIVSDIPVIKETHRDAGIYVNPHSIEDIADKIEWVYKNPDKAQEKVETFKKYRREFTIEGVTEEWMSYLERYVAPVVEAQ